MKKILLYGSLSMGIICIIYFSWTSKTTIQYSSMIDYTENPIRVFEVDSIVRANNKSTRIKPGNQSLIYWNDSVGKKTKYVLLYLHGFSACPMEGDPIHLEFAKKYNMNMYAPLLADHGLNESEAMINFTGQKFLNSTRDAVKIARAMGDSLIIMSTSTGSTAALYLASNDQNKIHSLICFSPNIKIADSKSFLLSRPWGLQIARAVKGGNYHSWWAPEAARPFWHTKYRLESLVELQFFVENTMKTEVFKKVQVPVFVGYYYKDEDHQDKVVSVDAILKMSSELGTKSEKLHVQNIKDAGSHAMASSFFNKNTNTLFYKICLFADKVLYLD